MLHHPHSGKPCPQCASETQHLRDVSRYTSVDYYLCPTCGQVFTAHKEAAVTRHTVSHEPDPLPTLPDGPVAGVRN
jgi:transposase-like protein